jgi:hypothetical protein
LEFYKSEFTGKTFVIAIAKAIATASEVIGLSLEHREDYSGRGMYGSDTHAIVGSQSDFMQACCYAAATIEPPTDDTPDDDIFDLDEFIQEIGCLRTDTMGRHDQVWY